PLRAGALLLRRRLRRVRRALRGTVQGRGAGATGRVPRLRGPLPRGARNGDGMPRRRCELTGRRPRGADRAVDRLRPPPVAPARPRFDESLRIARELTARYEVALTLRALAATGASDGDPRAESDAILERLDVVFVPAVPLP